MSDIIEEYRARLRHALAQLEEMERELDSVHAERLEPIAVLGMACRFPGGANSPDAFFELLENEVDAVTEVPPDRWSLPPRDTGASPDERAKRWGAFIRDIDLFDAFFFGISPREANAMDPQQRLLLEVVWEALERGGQVPAKLTESSTGVFLGITQTDYILMALTHRPETCDFYDVVGNGHNFAGGRISYTLGLEGPNVSIDTACSSSLVAIHMACQSLRLRESDVAITGGINLMIAPSMTHLISTTHGLSPDGRCKTFDARANGFVRGEGAGIIVLKRLSDALRAGDPILALIRGSAINQDGRSAGIAAPNVHAQEALLRRALTSARVMPEDIGYVEMHGTGTPLGDPIEAAALKAILGAPRGNGSRCVLGAVKTNVAHLEAAAGVAGLMKAVLALQHQRIPKNLHFDTLNPRISLEGTPFVIPTESTEWPRCNVPRRAGVSSFGMSGTNAHMILEEAPEQAQASALEASAYLLPLSAKTPAALMAMAQSYAPWFSHESRSALQDIVYTASARRTHHEYRLAAVASSPEEFAHMLAAFARGQMPAGITQGEGKTQQPPSVVFVFPGQGSQWIGMGRQLLAEEPAFRAALEECDRAISQEAQFSVLERINADETHSRLDQIDVVQPLLFAMEVAIAALWRSWGIDPDCVVGHSMGEVGAAHVAGILSLEDAVKVICRRSRLLKHISGQGAMALVELPIAEAERAIAAHSSKLGIAVSNGPRSTVLSGDPDALEIVLAALEKAGIFCRRIKVDVASHSPQVEPLRADLLSELRDLRPMPSQFRMLSTVTGKDLQGPELTAAYWWDNLRQPVLFSRATLAELRNGRTIFLEISPHPILVQSIEENLKQAGGKGVALASMRRQADQLRTMLDALGSLYAQGVAVDWSKRYATTGRVVELPTYPWQRERFWIETPAQPAQKVIVANAGKHPLLGTGIAPASVPGLHVWEQWVSIEAFPYLADHVVNDETVFPGAGYIELALAAAAEVFGESGVRIDELVFARMLVLPRNGRLLLQVSLVRENEGRAHLTINSRAEDAKEWVQHATGTIRAESPARASKATETREVIETRCPELVTAAAHYEWTATQGLFYGTSFRGVQQVRIGKGEVLAHVSLPADVTDARSYQMHPALLDACIQAAGWSLRSTIGTNTFLPVKVSQMRAHERPGRTVWVHGQEVKGVDSTFSFTVLDEKNRTLFELGELKLQLISTGKSKAEDPFTNCLFEVAWQQQNLSTRGNAPQLESAGPWVLLTDERGFGRVLAERLRSRGQPCVEVVTGHGYAKIDGTHYRLDPTSIDAWSKLFAEVCGNRSCRGVIHCGSLDGASWSEMTGATLRVDLERGSLAALRIAQALLRQGSTDTPRLYVLTRGAQTVGSDTRPVSAAQATLWGFGRALALERPDIAFIRIDLPFDKHPNEPEWVFNELLAAGPEDQIALRAEGRYVARLVRGDWKSNDSGPEHQEPASGRPFRMEIHKPGVLERLALRPMERRAPGPGEVEIEVEAAGLNFKDVLLALGVLPDDTPDSDARTPRLGGECAGRIVRIGEGVQDLDVGQEVVAIAPTALATHVLAKRVFVAPKPAQLSWAEAATLPIAFVTAYYALAHVARLQPGEGVLIHAGAGGVGMAAIQYAKHVRAEIFATAGNEEKRAALRSMGVHHVLDSRSLSFVDDVLRITNGKGVDVVLNSLAGEYISASFGLLRDHGRFVELGKKDYYENRHLGLRPFLKSLTFSLVDLNGMTFNHPEAVATLLTEALNLLEDGVLKPIAVQTFPVSAAVGAFAFMAQGKHIGKLAIDMRDPAALVTIPPTRSLRIVPGKTYLITGGFGGLGLSLARWVIDQGASSLALVGRRSPNPTAKATIDQWRAAGRNVRIFQADVSQRADVDAVIAEIDRGMPPLGGVVHAAGLLDDRTVAEMSVQQFLHPMEPKVFGGWNLHQATRTHKLDFFVAYSSASALLGSPGQTNYAAANAFLDALCQARSAAGLPATSIQWGLFDEVGLAAANDLRGNRLIARGGTGWKPTQGNELFQRALNEARPVMGILRIDMEKWKESFPRVSNIPYFEAFAQARDTAAPKMIHGLVDTLQNAKPDERIVLLEKHVLLRTSQVLRLDPARIDRLATFSSIGMDSLMSLELRNRLEPDLALKISATLLFAHPTPAALAEYLLGRLQLADAPPAATELATVPTEIPAESPLEQERPMSEVEEQIEAKLAALSAYLD